MQELSARAAQARDQQQYMYSQQICRQQTRMDCILHACTRTRLPPCLARQVVAQVPACWYMHRRLSRLLPGKNRAKNVSKVASARSSSRFDASYVYMYTRIRIAIPGGHCEHASTRTCFLATHLSARAALVIVLFQLTAVNGQHRPRFATWRLAPTCDHTVYVHTSDLIGD